MWRQNLDQIRSTASFRKFQCLVFIFMDYQTWIPYSFFENLVLKFALSTFWSAMTRLSIRRMLYLLFCSVLSRDIMRGLASNSGPPDAMYS